MPIIHSKVLKITLISLGSMLLAHMMISYNLGLVILGGVVTSVFIFYHTLRKNEVFSFVMVIYFCSLFPFNVGRGGAFNMVTLICVLLYFLLKHKMPYEYRSQSKSFNWLVFLFLLSSILGWYANFVGTNQDFLISIISFSGIVLLILVSSHIVLNEERILLFLKLNFVLIIYSTIASANKFLKIITIRTPMMPVWGDSEIIMGNVESGGIIGISPMYGQHSMLVAMLFATFFIFGFYYKNKRFNKRPVLAGLFIAVINVFLSISKAVFFSTIAGIGFIYIFQYKLINIKPSKQLVQLFIVLFFGFGTLLFIKHTNLDYVFKRIEIIEERTINSGGFKLAGLLDGSALNRKEAFAAAFEKYKSKDNWWIGYGWNTAKNNRSAFYVDTSIKRSSAHSQFFAVLFMFGWLGFIAFFGLHLLGIYKSFKLTGIRSTGYTNRLYALFSMIILTLLMLHGITADNISWPTYFGSTIILIGMSFSNIASVKYIK